MKQLNLYLIQLLLINWTASFAQHGVSKDTSRCYGLTELRHIAKTAVDLNTCDTLLSTSKKMLANRDTLIKEKDYTITQYSLTVGLKDQQIKNREDTIAVRNKRIHKLNNQKRGILIGWAASAVLEAALFIYLIIH